MTRTDPAKQIIDSLFVDPMAGDHLIGDAGDLRDLRWDRKAGVFQPLPGAENLIDAPVVPTVLEEADAELDNLVLIGIGAVVSTSTTAATSFGVLSGRWYSACGSSRVMTR
jgi:hypothetical protein